MEQVSGLWELVDERLSYRKSSEPKDEHFSCIYSHGRQSGFGGGGGGGGVGGTSNSVLYRVIFERFY